MTIGMLRPQTLKGIKSLAVKIKRDRGIPHHEALEVAAKQAGFETYRHAHNVLDETQAPAARRFKVYVTAYWKDRKTGQAGRETLQRELSVPWQQLVTDQQMKSHRALMAFRREGVDHLALAFMDSSASEARRHVCAASRTLDFMDATRLRPSSSSNRAYPEYTSRNAPPKADHVSVWFEPKTKAYVIADEPYEAALEREGNKRTAWAEKFRWQQAKPNWPGMYNPDGVSGGVDPLLFGGEDAVLPTPAGRQAPTTRAPVRSPWSG